MLKRGCAYHQGIVGTAQADLPRQIKSLPREVIGGLGYRRVQAADHWTAVNGETKIGIHDLFVAVPQITHELQDLPETVWAFLCEPRADWAIQKDKRSWFSASALSV